MHIDCSQNCTTSLVDDAANPSSSVAASCTQVHKDLVTVVHNEQHMCPVQARCLQKINASTTVCLMC